jgi:hypothetical protein
MASALMLIQTAQVITLMQLIAASQGIPLILQPSR